MKREEAVKILIDKMFEFAGHNIGFKDILGRKDDWFVQYTMTEDQNKKWVKWGEEFLYKNKLIRYKKLAKKEMSWFNLAYGLKIV